MINQCQSYRITSARRHPFRRAASVGLAAVLAATTMGSAIAQEAISLPLPAQAPTLTCTPVTAVSDQSVSLKRTFFDDFDSLDLSTNRWTPHYDGGYDWASRRWQGYDWVVKRTQPSAREQQIYVDPSYRGKSLKPLGLNPFKVENSILTITAEKIAPENAGALAGFDYTSGLLTTRKSFTQKFGYFETRAKVPAGPHLLPAFWMFSDDRTAGQELDVMEAPGHPPDKDKIIQSVHGGDKDGKRRDSGCRTLLPGFEKDFHYYGALWTPERIVFYIDRKPVGQIIPPDNFVWPMYMMVNLAVGGTWVGVAGADTPTPVTFDIDNVSAYTMGDPQACTVATNGVRTCQGQ